MKRRIAGASHTGLGGGGKSLIDVEIKVTKKRGELIKECSKEAYELFFKGTKMDYDYVDGGVKHDEVRIGVEPNYMYERLKMLIISEDKARSRMVTGYSWGGWGTDIRQTERFYRDRKTKSKFVRFVDKWHPKLFNI